MGTQPKHVICGGPKRVYTDRLVGDRFFVDRKGYRSPCGRGGRRRGGSLRLADKAGRRTSMPCLLVFHFGMKVVESPRLATALFSDLTG